MPRLLAVIAVALVLTGCSGAVEREDVRSAQGSFPGLTVSGDPGSEPQVRIAAPLKVTETRSEVLVRGTGAPIVVDRLFVVHLTVYNARTGKRGVSTYDADQAAFVTKTSDGMLFPALNEALSGVRQGSRVVQIARAQDGFGGGGADQFGIDPGDPLVLVADVMAVPPTEVLDRADGRTTEPEPGRPDVVVEDGVPATVKVASPIPPERFRSFLLLEGDGPAVRGSSLITVRMLSQIWGEPEAFATDFGKEPVVLPVGVGDAFPGWDKALIGVPRGSRLLVVAPPEPGFAATNRPSGVPEDATITYVIDVLGVS